MAPQQSTAAKNTAKERKHRTINEVSENNDRLKLSCAFLEVECYHGAVQ